MLYGTRVHPRSRVAHAHPRDYAWPPGTLALVHNPGKHGGADDLTHARYGRVIRMEKDVPRFDRRSEQELPNQRRL